MERKDSITLGEIRSVGLAILLVSALMTGVSATRSLAQDRGDQEVQQETENEFEHGAENEIENEVENEVENEFEHGIENEVEHGAENEAENRDRHGPPVSPECLTAENRLRTRLVGAPLGDLVPSGHADFRALPAGHLRLNVEVEDVNLTPGTVLQVLVNGTGIGTITLDSFLGGELEVNTRDGDVVPQLSNGAAISVLGPDGLNLTGFLQPLQVCPPTPQSPADVPPVMIGDERIRLETRLAGAAIGDVVPEGHADFRLRPDKGEARLNVEVEDVNLPPGTVLQVFVDGTSVGTIMVGPLPLLGGELELNNRDGDVVPQLNSGSVVTVQDPSGVIFTGTLQAKESEARGREPEPGDDRGGHRGSGGDSRGSDDSGSRGDDSGSGHSGRG